MRIAIIFLFLTSLISMQAQELDHFSHEPHYINNDNFETIHSLGEDGMHNIYAGTENAKIFKYSNESWTFFSIPGSNGVIKELTGDKNGNLYVAVDKEGLWVYKDESWNLFNHQNSPYPSDVEHGGIAWDEENKILWLGTNTGLISYQADSIKIYNFETYGLPMIDDEVVDLILDKDDKSVWMIARFSTLMHLDNEVISSQAVGWDLEIYDLVFKQIGQLGNGNIVLSTQNHGLMIYDHDVFEFIEDFEHKALSMEIDQFNHIWATNEDTLWNYDFNILNSYQDPFVPEVFYEVFVSSDNHVWIAGKNGPISEITQIETSTNDINNFEITIYPNPIKANNNLNIDIGGVDRIETLNFYNSMGQKISTEKHIDNLKLDLEEGIYFIQIRTNEGQFIKRLFVE